MDNRKVTFGYLIRTFSYLGITAFGGYTALVSLIQKKLVDEDKTIEERMIFDGITIASILPGPLAVNVVSYIGYNLKGWWGAIICSSAILFPSFVLMILLTELYLTWGYLPEVTAFMAGVEPIIGAVILSVSFDLFRKNVLHTWQRVLFGLSIGSLFFYSGYLALIAGIVLGSTVGYFFGKREIKEIDNKQVGSKRHLIGGLLVFGLLIALSLFFASESNRTLFVLFSKISLTLFGGGYVMIPVIHEMVVTATGWLNDDEFAKAIAFGQITPGPILISAAFVGYKVNGLVGALTATLGIFMPASVVMVITGYFYENIRKYPVIGAITSGIRPVVVAFILISAYIIVQGSDPTWFTYAAFTAGFLLLRFSKINFLFLMLGSCILSYFIS